MGLALVAAVCLVCQPGVSDRDTLVGPDELSPSSSLVGSGFVLAQASKKTSTRSTSAKKSSTKKPTASTKKSGRGASKKPETKAKTSAEERPTTHTTATLGAAIDSLVRGSGNSVWSIAVAREDTNEVIYEHNADKTLIPASNRKLFTGALALDQLGHDFRYQTYLYRTGNIDNSGSLNGNLVIRPQGDPTFSNRMETKVPPDWIYRDWVQKVKAAGIKRVSGELLIDCSEWDLNGLTAKGWAENVRQDTYAPQASPLTVNENVAEIKVRPGEEGAPVIIDFYPPAQGYPLINNALTKQNGGRLSIKRNNDGRLELNGTMAPKASQRSFGMPIDNPALFAAAVLRHYLHAGGVTISGPLRMVTKKNTLPRPTAENVVAAYFSPPLSEVVTMMMKRSNNHFAEQLYVSISAIKMGMGSYANSKRLEADLLRRAGIDPSEVQCEDGSGLSRSNMVSARQVCQLLTYMGQHREAQMYFGSMAVGGEDGTLRGRMHGENLAGRVHAKTGYINRVSCLSGYFLLAPDTRLVFSLLANEVSSVGSARSVQDRVCLLLSRLVL
jgi:serine-type D-Ala-D-Ala carboxypeptidase/endopeptidase (penicillin-binding protein 4)